MQNVTTAAEPTRWVIGRGLLGTAIMAASASPVLSRSIHWRDPASAHADLEEGLARLVASSQGPIQVLWCAGKGVTSTPEEALEAELVTFTDFVDLLAALPLRDRSRLTVFLASSVGGAYAGSPSPPFTESTPPVPLSAYGRTKLRMERALIEAAAQCGWRSFIARITNLFGAGQDMTKGQGLLSVLVASYITRRPPTIFVSLDTLRDYILTEDCARVILAGTDRAAAQGAGTTVLKVVGAMAAQSVGAILGENRRLNAGRRAPVVLGPGPATGQALDLRVRSEVWTDLDALVQTTLPEGLHRLHLAQLGAYARGADR